MEKYTLKRITIEEIPEPSMRLFDPEVDAVAIKAIEAVRSGGEVALRRWAQEFDGLAKGAPLVIAREEMKAAYDSLPEETAALLGRAKGRVAAFAAAQRACLAPLDVPALGGRHGHEFVPVARAGCYVPGGAFPLPSSALMTVIPAKAAGVPEVWCAGPKPTRETLAAAWLAGADGFLQCGGAHAIAALAFGIAVPRCDVIIGPGGKYVAAAKRLLYGIVGTEAPAGPSELLVIADESADPDIVAADLLAQAEHSPDAMPALIATHSHIADQIDRILRAQLAALPEPNRSIAQRSLQNGFCCIEPDPARIADGANHCAPEHLEIATSEPRALAKRIKNAGAIFLGSGSAEVFGDYGAGPNHTLPTGGASRFAAGLSVLHFLRARTWLAIDDPAGLADDTAAFARLEGLEAHARAALIRTRRSSSTSLAGTSRTRPGPAPAR
ncbi:Histidinol dehydrogenase [uncultured spirochete]|uniref:Histidinol dehydrogenase n=1 Tax=uncultured spirochete TaxID=156406 RepID=A0A3P3XJP5_9SPIR|nr:histidinol dehydrogenase [Rectinema subterraneum]SLM13909.1 Histidinol dehydrogenase [uncultured spirochete]HCX97173.1 histidinol dehydrogenase [Spirochaetaceae bacterium]